MSFNPYRVFKFVATDLVHVACAVSIMVSIPIGFSSSLQPHDPRLSVAKFNSFQSLSGFQVRCNALKSKARTIPITSFNPYRVFKFVATHSHADGLLVDVLSFNPYRVFKFVATQREWQHQQVCYHVSIPIGFSSSLQPIGYDDETCLYYGFNPYRVFKFVATSSRPAG